MSKTDPLGVYDEETTPGGIVAKHVFVDTAHGSPVDYSVGTVWKCELLQQPVKWIDPPPMPKQLTTNTLTTNTLNDLNKALVAHYAPVVKQAIEAPSPFMQILRDAQESISLNLERMLFGPTKVTRIDARKTWPMQRYRRSHWQKCSECGMHCQTFDVVTERHRHVLCPATREA